jgi:membrane fusion protein
MTSLFRSEAIEHARIRLDGHVVLLQPARTFAFTSLAAAIAVGALCWLLLGSYTQMQTVPGVVIADSDVSTIFPPHPGVVTKLFVREGELVHNGDPLAVVQTENQTANGLHPLTESLASLGEQERQAQLQLKASSAAGVAQRHRLVSTLEGALEKQPELESEISLQSAIVASTKHAYELLEPVVRKGFVSQTDFERRRQEYLTSEQQLASLRERKADNEVLIRQTRADIERAPLDQMESDANHRAQLETIRQQQLRARQESSYLLTAPTSGRLTAIQSATSRFVDGTKPLLSIAPTANGYAAELFIPSRAAGFLKPGQEVRLLFEAFPYEKYGSFGAHIVSVAQTVVRPDQLDAPIKVEEPVYRVRASIDDHLLRLGSGKIHLQPGMALRADVVLDRQSFLDWILSPIRAVSKRS